MCVRAPVRVCVCVCVGRGKMRCGGSIVFFRRDHNEPRQSMLKEMALMDVFEKTIWRDGSCLQAPLSKDSKEED